MVLCGPLPNDPSFSLHLKIPHSLAVKCRFTDIIFHFQLQMMMFPLVLNLPVVNNRSNQSNNINQEIIRLVENIVFNQ